MSNNKDLISIEEKLRHSPHWRDSFSLETIEIIGDLPVYKIKTSDNSPEAILSITKLNEILKK